MKTSIDKRLKEIRETMTKLGINIEIKSLNSPSKDNSIYEFNSIFFEGIKSSQRITQDHNIYTNPSEIVDTVCDFFKLVSEYREIEGVKS
jgi:hypothetical protein